MLRTGQKNMKLMHLFENMVPIRKDWTKDITGRVQKRLKSHFDANIADIFEQQPGGADNGAASEQQTEAANSDILAQIGLNQDSEQVNNDNDPPEQSTPKNEDEGAQQKPNEEEAKDEATGHQENPEAPSVTLNEGPSDEP